MVDYEIPADRLPKGFAERIEAVPEDPAPARPAATIVLLRERSGLEVLLLRRTRSAGFVPGAYVFPGGRVDAEDAAPDLVERVHGLEAEEAARRLSVSGEGPHAIAYYLAALREAFEETGILVARDEAQAPAPSAAEDTTLAALQDALLAHEVTFGEALDRAGQRLDGASVAYIAHWITPLVEPRRYDTRFFAAEVPAGTEARLNPAEMNHGIWLTPEAALQRHASGTLPMIFPTIKTLENLSGFDSPGEVIDRFREREIPALMPKLVRTPKGVGLELS